MLESDIHVVGRLTSDFTTIFTVFKFQSYQDDDDDDDTERLCAMEPPFTAVEREQYGALRQVPCTD